MDTENRLFKRSRELYTRQAAAKTGKGYLFPDLVAHRQDKEHRACLEHDV